MTTQTTNIANIFADMHLSSSYQQKYELAFAVVKMIHTSRISQRDIAEKCGWTQANVSALVNGRLEGISIGNIIDVALELGYQAEISFVRSSNDESDQRESSTH